MDQKGEESEEKKKHPKAPLREGGASRSEQQKGEWERGGEASLSKCGAVSRNGAEGKSVARSGREKE
jgi:hypothetical protein